MRTIRNTKTTPPAGFTLIELSIVILIMGILMAFVLAAGAASLEQARVRATQSLIAKLSVGLDDRLEALASISVSPNGAHRFLAAIPSTSPPLASDASGPTQKPWGLTSDQRAEVLARKDQIRAELPDVFFLDPRFGTTGNTFYPIHFAGLPYPSNATNLGNSLLPIGHAVSPSFVPDTRDPTTNAPLNTGIGGFDANAPLTGTGINGASYAAAAGLYKLIGYTPRGYDGIDNGNNASDAFPWVDDIGEGRTNSDGTPNDAATASIQKFLQNHQHKTARSEMLYAILMEGIGPLGSMFSSEDFRDTEIRDTDNDGVPEFVDGWGEPIQYFRSPVWHRSGGEPLAPESSVNRPVLQKGDGGYGVFETRQQNAFDPNGQLVALGWWSLNPANSPAAPSPKCLEVQNQFGPLYDPNYATDSSVGWDRSRATPRRAFFTKFLILSGGPDRQVGVPMLTDGQAKGQGTLTGIPTTTSTTQQIAYALNGYVTYNSGFANSVPGEGWATQLDASYRPSWHTEIVDLDVSLDDLTNQNLQNQAGGLQ